MKLKDKDIKRLLKDEVDKITPDVYSKVKAAPIHSLLSGETPEQAFKKRVVTLLLFITLSLLLVLSLSIIAYNATPSETPVDVSNTYISVTLTRGEDAQKIGIVADTTGAVICAVDETAGTRLNITDARLTNVLATVVAATEGDQIYVSVINDSPVEARTACEQQLTALATLYANKSHDIAYDVNNSNEKCLMASYINDMTGKKMAKHTSSVKTLTAYYVDMAEKLG